MLMAAEKVYAFGSRKRQKVAKSQVAIASVYFFDLSFFERCCAAQHYPSDYANSPHIKPAVREIE